MAGSNIYQFAHTGMTNDQASTAYQSAGDPSEFPSVHAEIMLDD